MALYYEGMPCSICGEVVEPKGYDWFGVTHFMDDVNDPLYEYSDNIFHCRCYENWEHKERFEELYRQNSCSGNEPIMPDMEALRKEDEERLAHMRKEALLEKRRFSRPNDILTLTESLLIMGELKIEPLKIDYYSGFEGYPEICFIFDLKQGLIELKAWEGYFEFFMDKIKPEPEGWTALAYYYHLDIGWYDESPWKVPDVGAVIRQFETIKDSDFNKVTRKVFDELYELFQMAESYGGNVVIEYF